MSSSQLGFSQSASCETTESLHLRVSEIVPLKDVAIAMLLKAWGEGRIIQLASSAYAPSGRGAGYSQDGTISGWRIQERGRTL